MSEIFNEMFGNDSTVARPFTDILNRNDKKELADFLKQYDTKGGQSDLMLILDKITITKDRNFDVNTVRYNKYIIEEMLSRSVDCYEAVLNMSMVGGGLTDQQHYDYLVRKVPVGRKNYSERVKKYMTMGAKRTLVKILLARYYNCNMEVAEEYYQVLESANKVDEFIMDQRWYLDTDECQEKAYKLLPHKDSRSEYDILVNKILGVSFDRN